VSQSVWQSRQEAWISHYTARFAYGRNERTGLAGKAGLG
jgi:hypothetical protein